MVFCTYCGQSFTRDEHLERHILTHTNVKPFKCFTCHMSFARRDLLQRHYTVHGRDQNQEAIAVPVGMIPKSAGRTPIACSNCAKTKTKCDKKFPCSRCAGRNLKCTLRPTRRSTKNTQRVGGAGEGGVVAMPPHVQPVVLDGVNPAFADGGCPPEHPHPLKLASPIDSAGCTPEKEHPAPLLVDGPPLQFHEHPISGPTLGGPPLISPVMPPPGVAFVDHPPLSGYEDFCGHIPDSSDPVQNPRFMLDWSQIPMPIGYDGMIQPGMLINPDMPFAPCGMGLESNGDAVLPMIPDGQGVTSLSTPMRTPKMERAFSDLELGSSPDLFNPHRHLSIASADGLNSPHSDIAPIVAARDAWTVFRCTPTAPSTTCPKTAKLHLELLEQTLRNHEGWSTWSPQWDDADFTGADQLSVMQLHESTRDKLLANTQSFLHKALEMHRDGASYHSSPTGCVTPVSNSGANFVLLPPARVLEYFLRSYANSFECHYPLTSRGILDANELLHCYDDRAASLLTLMMIAQGAADVPSRDARMLTGGLTEMCRISLFDLIERNVIMSGDPIVLHAALLSTVQAAWSGDKWQMDMAMAQRGVYLAMLKQSGVLDARPSAANSPTYHGSPDQMWRDWIQNESRSRLVYSWVMVDQDLSLFHDTAPLFSVNDCTAPMPDADRLWRAKTVGEWSSIFERVHEFSGGYSSVGSGARPLSLYDLFRHFLDDEMTPLGIELTPLHLRLLLHPLQTLVYQYGQLLSCFSDKPLGGGPTKEPHATTSASTRIRLGEVQALLRRWYDLAERHLTLHPPCAMMQTNLLLFHLISLNAVTDLAAAERLARREACDGTYPQLLRAHRRAIRDAPEALFHCGQVLRRVRALPRAARPPWWAAAVYRVALLLWADSLVQKDGRASPPGGGGGGGGDGLGPAFALDALPADHPLIVRYLTAREGVPCVTQRDGALMTVDLPYPVLQHCVGVIDEGAASRFAAGIRAKLDTLARG